MDKFIIHGGNPLKGSVQIKGSKNAALPMMAASLLLSDGELILKGVPNLKDVQTMGELLTELGVNVSIEGDTIKMKVVDEMYHTARYELVSQMRASFCVLGPLLAKRGVAKVSLPGGCVIGVRPVDLHLKGLAALGSEITIESGYVVAKTKGLHGAEIYLGGPFGPTVTGTQNVLMAAVLAEGTTIINHAACEPEVQELCILLNKMGARISGIGSHRLIIEGGKKLRGAQHEIIPDRIEAGTFMLACAIAGGDIIVENVRIDHLSAFIEALRSTNTKVVTNLNSIRVISTGVTRPTDITTQPYPGFPTDLQAQFMALVSRADGISVIRDTIYPDRFMHIAELNRMGANIRKEGNLAVVAGVKELSGATVMASDLRASAAMILAGLVAKQTTEVLRIYHIDRGYEEIEKRLNSLGADIERVVDKKMIVVDNAG